MTELTGLCCFTVSWSQLVRCLSDNRSDEMFPACVPSAIARWGALWSRRVWRAGWVTGPGRGAYQRAGCGRWAPHRAPCPLTPLGCLLEPLQLHPAGIWEKSRMIRGQHCSHDKGNILVLLALFCHSNLSYLLHFTLSELQILVCRFIYDIKISKLCCWCWTANH